VAPRSKTVGAFAGLVAVTLALSACSSPAEDDSNAELETLTIGTSGTFRPITYSEGGELTGFDIAVGTEVADRIGMKAEFVEGQLAGLIPGLDSGQFDALMSGLTQTEARLESVSFSVAYHAEGTIAVVATGSDITDVTDLSGLRVGAISGSGSEGDVEEIGGYESYVGYPGTPEGIADLIAGRIDVFATGRVAAQAYISTAGDGDQIELAGETYHLLPVGIALPKEGSEELMEEIDGALEEMTSDGTLADLQEEWLGFVPTIPES
jgi:ABC-type amino acid transport substrate-binding protein